MRPAAIIFDCDGVLADSEPQANRVLSGVLAESGILMSPDECREAFVGLNPTGVAAKVLSARGVDLRASLTSIVGVIFRYCKPKISPLSKPSSINIEVTPV